MFRLLLIFRLYEFNEEELTTEIKIIFYLKNKSDSSEKILTKDLTSFAFETKKE